LVETTQKRPVADYGFIHFKNRNMKKVSLMEEKEIIALYHRYWNVIGGEVVAFAANSKNYVDIVRISMSVTKINPLISLDLPRDLLYTIA
jgi:hypothetical protein